MSESTKPEGAGTGASIGLIAEAAKLIKANRLDEAKRICDGLVRTDERDVDALYALGWIAVCTNDVSGAEARFRRVIELKPDHARANYNLGTILLRSGKLADAAAHFEAAVAADPEFSDAFCNLGSVRLIDGRLDQAIENFRAAIALTPDHADAHYGLANALVKDKCAEQAVEHYRRAVAIRPEFADAHNALGVCFVEMEQPENAEVCFAKALEIKPDFAQAHNNLAIALRRAGKLKNSIASARTALQFEPQFVEALYSLGRALEMDGQQESALATYKKALEIKPDARRSRDRTGYAKIGNALQACGRFEEAVGHLRAAGDGNSKARILECCYALNRGEDFDTELRELCGSEPANLLAAGISAFAAHQWRKEDPYPFCKDPLDFVDIGNVASHFDSFGEFSEELLKEIAQSRSAWAPRRHTTVKGYHTVGNLFELQTPKIAGLRDLIFRQIEAYRSKYADRRNAFIGQWPGHAILNGWHVKVGKEGYQTHHIHPTGWLSGVFYLKIPESLEQEEGSITFSLRVPKLPVADEDIPELRHTPSAGDMVLFPSSLYHYTSPFGSDGERHVVAFDLCPRRAMDG